MNPYAELLCLIRRQRQGDATNIYAGTLVGDKVFTVTLMDEPVEGQVHMPLWYNPETMQGKSNCIFYYDDQNIVILAIY